MFEVLGVTLSVVLAAAAAISSSMVLFNLRSMNRRIEKLEVAQMAMANHKSECRKDFVDKVDYIRSVNSVEASLKELIKATAEIKGSRAASTRLIEQMPQICGSIARDIVKEMKS